MTSKNTSIPLDLNEFDIYVSTHPEKEAQTIIGFRKTNGQPCLYLNKGVMITTHVLTSWGNLVFEGLKKGSWKRGGKEDVLLAMLAYGHIIS